MKAQLIRIVIGGLLLALSMVAEHELDLSMCELLMLFLIPYLVVGGDIIWKAMKQLFHGRAFDEHLLMCIASMGVFGISFFPGVKSELHEAVSVMLLFQIGELFEHYAEHRSERSIASLLEMEHYSPERAEAMRHEASDSETFIRRFARVYTPIVVGIALFVGFVPPLFSASYVQGMSEWLYRSLTFLVVSCPCALVISVPLSFFGGIGKASSNGILLRGSHCMDMLAKVPMANVLNLSKVPATIGIGKPSANQNIRFAVAGANCTKDIAVADVVFTADDPKKVTEAVKTARRTLNIARQNVAFAIGIKLLVLLLATFGMAAMWMAVFADVGVTVLAVLNSMRAMR